MDRHRTCDPLFHASEAVHRPGRQELRRIAVVFGEDSLTYGELDARANQLAHHLRDLGVGLETVVGLCVERSPEMIIGLLRILKAGGVSSTLSGDSGKAMRVDRTSGGNGRTPLACSSRPQRATTSSCSTPHSAFVGGTTSSRSSCRLQSRQHRRRDCGSFQHRKQRACSLLRSDGIAMVGATGNASIAIWAASS